MTTATRMLLSHNCALPEDLVSTLSRDAFAAVFIEGLKGSADIQCQLIDNPHWIVEILFDSQQHSPTTVAELCAQSLSNSRLKEQPQNPDPFTVMLLGGLKTSPAMGNAPTSLQPGEWGVDVVETFLPDQFLVALNWDAVIADKSPENIFKVTHIVA